MPTKDKKKRKEYSHRYYTKNREKKLAKHKDWRDNNKEHIKEKRTLNRDWQKNYMLLRNYNITLEQYNEMFANQNGCCAICEKHATEFKYGLAVDHNHETGKVGLLLCGKCNTALGLLNNDKKILLKMLTYLENNF